MLAGLSVGALLMMFSWRSLQQVSAAPLPSSLQTPAKASLRELKLPVPPADVAPAAANVEAFEVGVAVFAGPTRAGRLEAELATMGYNASTRSINLAGRGMFEVRTGPYSTREAAEADVLASATCQDTLTPE